jgi:integrase
LSDAAIAVLADLKARAGGEIVFPSVDPRKPLSNGAMLAVLERMGRGDITPHGFRSTFRDWVAEATHFAGEVAEMALAHAIKGQTEAAYRRGDLFEKRRRLMQAWADYAGGVTGTVVALRDAAS